MAEAKAQPTSPPGVDTGDLALEPFGRVFSRLTMEAATGFLDVLDQPSDDGGKVIKRVAMVQGANFSVRGGSVKETLPEILVAQGKLTAEAYAALKEETKGKYGEMEQKILTGAVVPASELADLVTFQTALKIKSLFAVIRGAYEFRRQSPEAVKDKYSVIPLFPDKLLLEAVAEYYPEARIRKEFTGIEKKTFHLEPGWDSRLTMAGHPLNLIRVFQTTGEKFTWASIAKSLPLEDKAKSAFLLSLYLSGMTSLPDGEDDFPLGRAYLSVAEARRMEKKPVETKSAPEEKKSEAAPPPEKKPEPKLPIEEILDRQFTDEDYLTELENFTKQVSKKDSSYFDWMGVEQNTPPAKIKQIYFKFAKKYHPDARPDLFKDKVKDKVEDLFTKITEAYDTLGDNEKRTAYLKDINSKVSKEDMEKATRAIEAEMEFQKAEIMLKRGSWQGARELIDRAIQLQPDEPEFKLYLAWCDYKIKGPSEAAKAKKEITKALETRPKVADGYYYLGVIAKNEGDTDEAEKYLGKALKLKPADVDIKRELQMIQRKRSAPSSSKKGGLFGKKR